MNNKLKLIKIQMKKTINNRMRKKYYFIKEQKIKMKQVKILIIGIKEELYRTDKLIKKMKIQ